MIFTPVSPNAHCQGILQYRSCIEGKKVKKQIRYAHLKAGNMTLDLKVDWLIMLAMQFSY